MGKTRVILAVVMTFVLLCSSIDAMSDYRTVVSSTEPFELANGYPGIYIDSDGSFADNASAYGWAGSGNATHPYIIEGYSIDALGVQGACISISNTRVHFIIKDCTLVGATWSWQGAGIFLSNVTNGVVLNNTLNGNQGGLWLDYSSDITVINNTMNGNVRAGMFLYYTDSIYYDNNTLNTKIELFSSGGNTFINNTLTGCGFEFNGYGLVDFSQTLVSDNTVNGKPLIFWQDQTGGTVPTGAGQVILVNCDGVTVEDQVIDSATNGICAFHSPNTIMTNNTLTGNYRGIHTESSSYLEIYENNCTANTRWGMYLGYASYAEIYDNICNDHVSALGVGIYIPYSHAPTVHNNNCTGNSFGIQLYSNTNYAMVADNNCSFNQHGINVLGGHDDTIRDNIVVGNTGRGISTTSSSYDNLIAENDIQDNGEGVYLGQSQTTEVVNNAIKAPAVGASTGVLISQGGNHIISYNEIEATGDAIFLDRSVDNDLNHNNLTGNVFSIYSYESNSSTITNNYMVVASTGLYLDTLSYDNQVTWNYFVNSYSNAIDDSINAYIDHNYWSNYTGIDANNDGIGDTFHPISGDSSNADWNPLFYIPEIPTWTEMPVDQYIELGEDFSYDLNATVSSLLGSWLIDDVTHFTIDSSGVITNTTSLVLGNYDLEVQVTDIYDTPLIGAFTVHVIDSEDPEWIVTPENQYLELGEDLLYQLEASDNSGVFSWSVNNTDDFTISASGLLQSIGVLDSGVYHLQVNVTDSSGNWITASFDITVAELSTTSTTPTPTTTTTPTTTPSTTPVGFDSMIIIGLGIGAAGVVVVIIVVVVRKKS